MFPVFILVAAIFAWLAVGSVAAVILAVGMLVIWLLRLRSKTKQRMIARNSSKQVYDKSRLIRRYEYDPEKGRHAQRGRFPEAQPTHAPTDWCAGWCDDPNGHPSEKDWPGK